MILFLAELDEFAAEVTDQLRLEVERLREQMNSELIGTNFCVYLNSILWLKKRNMKTLMLEKKVNVREYET